MFCDQCGHENPDTAVSCFRCGKPLSSQPAVPPSSTAYSGASSTPTPPAPSHLGYTPASVPPVIEPQTDGKATASLILGILSLTCFWIFTGIPAVILGHISRTNIRKSMGRLKGDGMALAGLIMGYISVATLPFVLIVVAIAIPNLLKARIAANEEMAIRSVRTIATASSTYQVDKSTYPVALEDMQKAGLIDETLASGRKSGYHFTYTSTGDHFFVVAMPETSGTTGNRSFCAAEDFVIRATNGEECTQESPALE